MLRAESEAHSRASVYSNNEQERLEHNGVVKWLDAVVNMERLEGYREQAEEKLGLTEPEPGLNGGTPYMAPDAMDDTP